MFHDVQFPVAVSQGAEVSYVFSTAVVQASSGLRQKNQNWEFPLREFDVTRVLDSKANRDAFISFLLLRGGPANSFRFRNPAEWYIGMDYVDNVLEHVAAHNFAVGDNSEDTFQLGVKHEDSVVSIVQPVYKPVSGSVKVYLDDVEQGSGWTLDYDTGILEFTSPPGLDVDIGWSGQYDVEAEFLNDRNVLRMATGTQGEGPVVIREVRPDV